MAEGMERITEEDDPNRCQAVIGTHGQCLNVSVSGTKYCKCHGGTHIANDITKKQLQNYRIEKYKARLDDFYNSDGIKTLRDEIAILRMLLEEQINRCKDSTDLLLKSQTISELVVKIEKLVSSCHKLEGSMDTLLDKQTLIQFAVQVIEVIGAHIHDETMISKIADGIMEIMAQGKDSE